MTRAILGGTFAVMLAAAPGLSAPEKPTIDPTKLERNLGWTAKVTFDEGIEATTRWYLENEWWWRPILARTYSGERLGVRVA